MANINIINRPFTAEVNYFSNGILDNTNERQNIFTTPYGIAANLDSCWSQLIWAFNTEVLTISSKSNIVLDFSTNPNITEVQIFNEILTQAESNLEFNQFYSDTSGFTIQERIDSFIECINSNINLNWRYYAYQTANAVVISAILNGSIYSLTNPNFNITTVGPSIISSYSPGTDGNRGELLQNFNYKVFVEVWEVENIDWNRIGSVDLLSGQVRTKITTLTQNWNPENRFIFDFSNFFNIETSIQDLTNNFTLTYKPRCYFLKFGEQFIGGYDPDTDLPIDTAWNIQNTNITKRYIGNSELRWISGGVFLQALINNNFPQYWLSSQYNTSSTNEYITVIPSDNFYRKLKRREYDAEYISVWVWNDQQYISTYDLRLKTDYRFIDGTSGTNYSHTTNGLSEGGLYTIDAGLSKINFDSIETFYNNRILYYDLTFEINRGMVWESLSDSIQYQIDLNDDLSDQKKKIWWVNSFGCIEQFCFEGFSSQALQTEYETYTKTISNVNFIERDKHINSIIEKIPQVIYKVNSGWLDKNNMTNLQSLLKSNKCWWLNTFQLSIYLTEIQNFDGQSYEAITITDHDWQIDNQNNLYNLQLTIVVAFENNTVR